MLYLDKNIKELERLSKGFIIGSCDKCLSLPYRFFKKRNSSLDGNSVASMRRRNKRSGCVRIYMLIKMSDKNIDDVVVKSILLKKITKPKGHSLDYAFLTTSPLTDSSQE